MLIVLVNYQAPSPASKDAFWAGLQELGPSLQLADAAYALKTRDLTVSGVLYFLRRHIGPQEDIFVLNQAMAENCLAKHFRNEPPEALWRSFVEAAVEQTTD